MSTPAAIDYINGIAFDAATERLRDEAIGALLAGDTAAAVRKVWEIGFMNGHAKGHADGFDAGFKADCRDRTDDDPQLPNGWSRSVTISDQGIRVQIARPDPPL